MSNLERSPQFAEAVRLFNRREFFACHDALEELWSEELGPQRDFLQGLIHAAVALFHFTEGNLGGARKMHDSALRYLAESGDVYAQLNLHLFRQQFDRCFAPLMGPMTQYPAHVRIQEDLIPVLTHAEPGFHAAE